MDKSDSRPAKEPTILIVRYILRELIPQFLSALIIICAIIVVSQLVRLSDVLVTFGLTLENVFLPFLYIILPFISLTIPMAFLFAVVLTFSRLSADGEYAALLASGFSLRRAAVPVVLLSLALYVIASMCALHLEPWGRRELVQFFYRKTQTELDNMVKYKMQEGVFLEDFLGYVLYAEKISQDRTNFENVMLAPGNAKGGDNFTLLAPRGRINGSVEEGDLRLQLDFGMAVSSQTNSDANSILRFKRAEIDLLRIFHQQILGADSKDDDYRSYRPYELWDYVEELKVTENRSERQDRTYLRASFLLHKRIGAPFACVTFALMGMALGISDPRRGKSNAYLGAILVIVMSYVAMEGAGWLAKSGSLPAPWAVWLPNSLLVLFGGFWVYQKNRLPPSESSFDPKNLPMIGAKRGGAENSST